MQVDICRICVPNNIYRRACLKFSEEEDKCRGRHQSLLASLKLQKDRARAALAKASKVCAIGCLENKHTKQLLFEEV